MLLLVQKRLCIFIILFGVSAGYYRHGSMDPAPSNFHSSIERPKPYQQAPMGKWGKEKPPYLSEKRPRSPHWSSSHYGAPGRAPMDMWIRVTLDIIAANKFNKFSSSRPYRGLWWGKIGLFSFFQHSSYIAIGHNNLGTGLKDRILIILDFLNFDWLTPLPV